jgi:hypothetical protein
MANPLFPKFNQSQQDQKQIQDSLKKIKTLSTKTEPQNRVALMQEIHRVRQRLRGKNLTLDRQLSQLANDAQKNVVSVHSGAREAVRGILDLLQTANSPSTARARSALASTLKAGLRDISGNVGKTIDLIEQLTPEIFGGNKTPEQAGGTRVDSAPASRQIIPAEPQTWMGMRLVGNNTVEIRTANFRGRYDTDDPAITGRMVPVVSSNVHSIGFQMNLKNPLASTLFVKYLQKYGNNGVMGSGPTYGYKNVHPKLFQEFMAANSKGGFVWDRLRVRGTVAGSQYEYYLDSISRGYVPRRSVIENGIQILKRRKRVEQKSGRTVVSQLREKVIGPYRPHKGSGPNRGNPDRGSQRPNRGR